MTRVLILFRDLGQRGGEVVPLSFCTSVGKEKLWLELRLRPLTPDPQGSEFTLLWC